MYYIHSENEICPAPSPMPSRRRLEALVRGRLGDGSCLTNRSPSQPDASNDGKNGLFGCRLEGPSGMSSGEPSGGVLVDGFGEG